MAPTKAKPKKEKIFHPSSRKAGQLAKAAIRKGKLQKLTSQRSYKEHSLINTYRFFHSALPEEGTLSLDELHHVVRDIWLARFDDELRQEQAARRKGRPKNTKEMKLEEVKLREAEEYRTGFEVIDLTHPINVRLFRKWDQKEVAYAEQLRFIRITHTKPDVVVLAKRGKHAALTDSPTSLEKGGSDAMVVSDE